MNSITESTAGEWSVIRIIVDATKEHVVDSGQHKRNQRHCYQGNNEKQPNLYMKFIISIIINKNIAIYNNKPILDA